MGIKDALRSFLLFNRRKYKMAIGTRGRFLKHRLTYRVALSIKL
jgi:hypothetical protein